MAKLEVILAVSEEFLIKQKNEINACDVDFSKKWIVSHL